MSPSKEVKAVYNASTALWGASGAHFQAQGHPGLPGPSSESKDWDEERAMLEGAIYTLQEIHKYRYIRKVAP